MVLVMRCYNTGSKLQFKCSGKQDHCAGGKIEKNQMGGACGAYVGGERCAQISGGET